MVGDSKINGFEVRGLCKGNHVKVRKHPGASSTDFIDHIKPVLRKTQDTIIIHAGTNNITNNINLLRNVKTISKMAKEESFSSVVNRCTHSLKGFKWDLYGSYLVMLKCVTQKVLIEKRPVKVFKVFKTFTGLDLRLLQWQNKTP